jgi:hypothetical protein
VEKNITQRRMVELKRTFNEVWESLCGKSVELKTDAGTPFVARAKIARRRGSSTNVKALLFLRNAGNGKLNESSRCYVKDWGYYFNHLGKNGQRIGMFCRTIDLIGK